ncbi:MAG: DinB family protein [Flavobacterium sp.]|nr:MAG: DinB family protein [Flavobacterium sp.]
MSNKVEMDEYLKSVFSDIEDKIELFDTNAYNKVLAEDSWTAGQIVEHVLLSAEKFNEVVNGEVEETSRAFDKLKAQLKAILLSFETKMKSPDFIYPPFKEYVPSNHTQRIQKVVQNLEEAIHSLDLTKTCVSFPLPGLGNLTRYEAIYFVIYHTERHLSQLSKIAQN